MGCVWCCAAHCVYGESWPVVGARCRAPSYSARGASHRTRRERADAFDSRSAAVHGSWHEARCLACILAIPWPRCGRGKTSCSTSPLISHGCGSRRSSEWKADVVGSSAVCGTSSAFTLLGGPCNSAVNFSTAHSICESAGGRCVRTTATLSPKVNFQRAHRKSVVRNTADGRAGCAPAKR